MPSNITLSQAHEFIIENLEGVVPIDAWGEVAYFYNPGKLLKRGTYFATIKEKDGENDKASNLDRDGVWRLNMGVSKQTFLETFNQMPARPAKGCSIEGSWDFTKKNKITPHPVYGWMSWMAVLNPSAETFEECKLLLIDAHKRAQAMFIKRTKKL